MEILKYKPLIIKLTLREIKARYKQSFLGFFWVILNPFFQMLIMSFVFSNILRFSNLGVPYPVYLYAGLLVWGFFSASLTTSMDALSSNGSLIKKIYFPREILILSTLLAKAFDLMLAFIIFFLLMIFFGVPITPFVLLFIPIFLLQFIFTYGLSLILSAANLFYRDVQYLFNLILTLWFYLTPVIYPTELFPERFRWIFKINPMAVIINAYRQVLLGGDWPKWSSMGVGILISVILFILGYSFFKRLEGTFADVV